MINKKSQAKPSHRFGRLGFGLIVLVITLLVGQIILSNRLATQGKQLAQLEQEMETLMAENKRLRTAQAEQASLSELADSAREKGFIKNPLVVVLPQDQTVALRP